MRDKKKTEALFYERGRRHVRGMKSAKNERQAKIHPALIVGERPKKYFSMGMTTTEPKSAKQRKKVISLKQKTREGKNRYLFKHIQERDRINFSPEIYSGFKFTDDEHEKIDRCILKKKTYLAAASKKKGKQK